MWASVLIAQCCQKYEILDSFAAEHQWDELGKGGRDVGLPLVLHYVSLDGFLSADRWGVLLWLNCYVSEIWLTYNMICLKAVLLWVVARSPKMVDWQEFASWTLYTSAMVSICEASRAKNHFKIIWNNEIMRLSTLQTAWSTVKKKKKKKKNLYTPTFEPGHLNSGVPAQHPWDLCHALSQVQSTDMAQHIQWTHPCLERWSFQAVQADFFITPDRTDVSSSLCWGHMPWVFNGHNTSA